MEDKYENNSSLGNGSGQENYGSSGYGQSSYNQGSYSQNSYSQNDCGQTNYGQGNYSQNNYDPNGYMQGGYQQGNYAPNSYSQNSYSQNGYPQNSYGQGGYSQNNYNQGSYYQNAYRGNSYNQNGMPGTLAPTPATEAVREVGKSFPFLFGTICYTLSFILSVVSLFFPASGYMDYSYIGYTAYGAEIVKGAQLVGSCIGVIPVLLIVTGMWMLFASCAGKRQIPSATGITLNRGAIITYIVVLSILIGLAAIVGGIWVYAITMNFSVYYEFGANQTTLAAGTAVLVAIVLIVVALLILCLIYFIKMLKTTRVIRNVLRTGQVTENISMYHIVFNFIAVLLNVFLVVTNFVSAPYIAGSVPSAIQAALGVISYISVTVALLLLRSKLKACNNSAIQ